MVRNRSTNKDYSCYDMAPMEDLVGDLQALNGIIFNFLEKLFYSILFGVCAIVSYSPPQFTHQRVRDSDLHTQDHFKDHPSISEQPRSL